MWRGLSLKRYVGRDYKVHAMSADRISTETSAQFPRDFRAQSILQTETSVLWDIVFTEVLLNTTKALGCFMVVLLTLCDSWSYYFFSFYNLIYVEAEENVASIKKQCKVDSNLIAEHLKPTILMNVVA